MDNGIMENHDTSKALVTAAQSGDSEAQTRLGVCMTHGIGGLERDDVAAVVWFRRAAEGGYAPAQYFLGRALMGGRGVAKDAAEALVWLGRAAAAGHSGAMLELAAWYGDPDGADYDPAKSTALYIAAAERTLEEGDDEDAGELFALVAGLYERGEGTVADPQKAAMWRERSKLKIDSWEMTDERYFPIENRELG